MVSSLRYSPAALVIVQMLLKEHLGTHVLNSRTPRRVPALRQCFNVLCCFLSLPFYFFLTVSTHFPITLDLLMTITLTELNRFVNERRRQRLYQLEHRNESPVQKKETWLKQDLNIERAAPRLDCVAAVVGWKEDPSLFHRALKSYSLAQGCAFLLVGVDGDGPEDQDMVDVFNEVRTCQKDSRKT